MLRIPPGERWGAIDIGYRKSKVDGVPDSWKWLYDSDKYSGRFVADFIGKMNLFEGQVTSSRDGTLDVAISGLGDLEIPHDEPASGEIGIAIRPEKLRVTVEQPAESCICFAAVLDNVAYHGSENHMHFTTDSGAKLTATAQNETRTRASIREGERLWVRWTPGDTLVLAE